MARREDWPEELHNAIVTLRMKPFVWGWVDCALFACACLEAMTGIDHAVWFRGRYRTREEAEAAIAEFCALHGKAPGLAGVAEAIAAERGYPEIAPALAQRGDILLFDQAPLGQLGVCLGPRAAVAAEPQGIGHRRTRDALRAWRIPV